LNEQLDQNPRLASRPCGVRLNTRSRLSAIAVAAAAAVSLGLAICVPASAATSADRAAGATLAHARSATAGGQEYNGTYRANDGGGYYLAWNGVFKGQMRTTGDASTLTEWAYSPTACTPAGECGLYMWELGNSGNCLEYDGTNTAVIADTCTATRASQWWYPEAQPSSFGTFVNQYNGCWMFADSDTSGSLVNCNGPQGDYEWKIYPHS
jgi:hypothetical protein